MPESDNIAKLTAFLKNADETEVLEFIEELCKKRPELSAELLKALQQSKESKNQL